MDRSTEQRGVAQSRGEVVIVYAGERAPSWWHASVFLAGPTPRSPQVASWRPDAISEVRRQWDRPGRLVVFVPEAADGSRWPSYDNQIAWEEDALARCDVIAFYVPRDMATLPGLTTNVEFGRHENSGRVVLGLPENAAHVTYLRHYAHQYAVPVTETLADLIAAALGLVGDGERRNGGHRDVPLLAYRTPSFRQWLAGQEAAGNQLEGGRLAWTFRAGRDRRTVFLWVFHARVRIAAEDRVKADEIVLGRPDVCSVLAYRPGGTLADTEIVLVREFRSPGCTTDGYVRELPGGSGTGDTADQAVGELAEEAGLVVDAARVRAHGARQAVATVAAHRHHVFSVELTTEEIARLRADTQPHGVAEDSERTFVEVRTFGELLAGAEVDWTTLGMISQVLLARGTS